jgi:hypothetical protein
MIRYSSYGRTNYRPPTLSERALAEECCERMHPDSLANTANLQKNTANYKNCASASKEQKPLPHG